MTSPLKKLQAVPSDDGDLLDADPGVTDAASHAMEQVSTEHLIDRARSGDREAYGMLFERFHDEIYRFAARRLGDPVAGQDVAAETFADAFGSLHRFQWNGAPFQAWLYTIARRRIADAGRARARSERLVNDATRHAPDHSDGVDDSVLMRALIAQLPDADRDVIELRFMEDLDVEQAAARLGKSPGAVRVAQHRALQRLRTLMVEAGVS